MAFETSPAAARLPSPQRTTHAPLSRHRQARANSQESCRARSASPARAPRAETARPTGEPKVAPGAVPLSFAPAAPNASLQSRVVAQLRSLALVACGLGVVTGLSWTMAATGTTAAMLKLLSGASVLDRVAGSVPFIGPLLAVLMGVGGNYGFGHVGLIVFYVVDACFGQRDRAGSIGSWLRAHGAMASALSPLWLAGATPMTAPVVLGVAAGVGYLSWTIQRAQGQATPPNFNHALFSLGVSLALAPIGAQAAVGTAAIRIARQAVNFPLLAFGCIAIVSALRQVWTLFGSGAGGVQGGAPMRTEGATVYDGVNAAEATVFVPQDVVDAAQDIVVRVREDVAHGRNDGPRCYLLRAPRGAGKHALACGLANALQTRLYKLERAAFEALGKGHSGRALAQQMQQWGEQAEELGRPVLIYVPELTKLAPRAEQDDFVSQLKTLLANEGGGRARNLIFLLATSEPAATARARIDGAILNRVTRTLRWGPLSADELPRVLEVKLRQHLQASSIHRELVNPFVAQQLSACARTVLEPARLQRALRRASTGSDVDAWAVEAVDDTVSSYLRQRRADLAPDEPSADFPLATRLTQRLTAVIEARLAGRELGDDDAEATSTASTPTTSPPTTPQPPRAARLAPLMASPASDKAASETDDESVGG